MVSNPSFAIRFTFFILFMLGRQIYVDHTDSTLFLLMLLVFNTIPLIGFWSEYQRAIEGKGSPLERSMRDVTDVIAILILMIGFTISFVLGYLSALYSGKLDVTIVI